MVEFDGCLYWVGIDEPGHCLKIDGCLYQAAIAACIGLQLMPGCFKCEY
jgi:hypothetical protein